MALRYLTIPYVISFRSKNSSGSSWQIKHNSQRRKILYQLVTVLSSGHNFRVWFYGTIYRPIPASYLSRTATREVDQQRQRVPVLLLEPRWLQPPASPPTDPPVAILPRALVWRRTPRWRLPLEMTPPSPTRRAGLASCWRVPRSPAGAGQSRWSGEGESNRDFVMWKAEVL